MESFVYRFIVAYAGTNYFGWQKTGALPTIQGALEKAALQVVQEEVIFEAASRTDRGVHARGQVVQCTLSKPWPAARLQRALNAVLPPDIRIVAAEESTSLFHPTLHARAKTYRYYLCLGAHQSPFDRLFSWHYPYPIDLAKMQHAANQWIGENDMSAFTTQRRENNIRSLHVVEFTTLPGNRLCIELTADRFLYKMARTLVGTLANIGSGKLPLDIASKLVTSPERALAGVTAPPHGLTLYKVYYGDKIS